MSRSRVRTARRSVRAAQIELDRLRDDGSPVRRGLMTLGVGVVVVAVALAVATVVWRVAVADGPIVDGPAYSDRAYVDTARSVVGALLVPDARDPQRADDILAASSGSFRDQFAQSSGAYGQLVRQLRTTASGDVDGVAIADRRGDRADVLVTAAVTTTRPGGQDPALRKRFRVVATVEPDGGRLTVSELQVLS